MIAYIDASVPLRIVLGDPRPLGEWDLLTLGVSSRLLDVECERSLNRLWLMGRLDETTFPSKRVEARTILDRLEILALDETILRSATRSLPVPLGTLDAIHLVSAMRYRDAQAADERPIVFATHDAALARAAEAMRFEVIGV